MAEVVAGGRRQGNVVCDIDGVIYRGSTPIEGAGDALRRLEAMGFAILFVTNNSTTTPHLVAQRISQMSGYEALAEQVLGSAEAAATILESDKPETMVVGGAGIEEALLARSIPMTDDPSVAGAVVVGLDRAFSYAKLDAAATAIRNGARFIATNTDITFPGADGIHPGAGAIVAAIEAASGVHPVVAGKPHSAIRALIRQRLRPGPVWVVGDRPDTDLALARAERWHAALVLTGIASSEDDVPKGLEPDLIVESIASLPERIDPA
jgi:4-nitrophenyl phosphatase